MTTATAPSANRNSQRQRNAKPSVAGQGAVRLERICQKLRIYLPHDVDGLARTFWTTRHQPVSDDEHGCRVERRWFPLVQPRTDILESEGWKCWAGLQPLVEHWLKRNGYTVDSRLANIDTLPTPRRVEAEEGLDVDGAVLRCIRRHDRALLRCGSPVQPDWLVAQVARAWPDKTMMVIASTADEARDMAARLRYRALDAKLAHSGCKPNRIGRILVATPLSTGRVAQTREIAIVLDARTVLSANGMTPLHHAENARLYGMLPLDAFPAPFARDMMTALFGCEELRIPEHGCVAEPVEVVTVPFQGSTRLGADENTDYLVRRKAIIENNGRNQFVARLGRAIQTGKPDTGLQKLSRSLQRRISSLPGQSIAILAANVEHALALHRLIPDAGLLTGEYVYEEGLSEVDKRRLHHSASRNWQITIATPAVLGEIVGVDVLIRVDAAPGIPQTNCVNVYRNWPAVVIDVGDRHHPLLRRWNNERQAVYRQIGWNMDVDAEMDVLDAFIASRNSTTRPQQQIGGNRRPKIRNSGYRSSRNTTTSPQSANQHRPTSPQTADNKLPPLVFADLVSRNSLYQSLQAMERGNGTAPGIDGIALPSLSPTERGNMAQAVSTAIQDGSYRPKPTRPVDIPKPGTSERRRLQIGALQDRMVAKAIHTALTPYFEKLFLPGSWGFRPGRSPMTMLADMEASMMKTGRWVAAIDDIRKAFDNVPIKQLITAHDKLLNSQPFKFESPEDKSKLLQLLTRVLLGHNQQRETGIDQGNPYSPTALNALLHLELDLPFQQERNTLWYRYADNLVYLAHSVSEGQEALQRTRELLDQVDMTLKGAPGEALDLAGGQEAELFGVAVRKQDNHLEFGPGRYVRDGLVESLERAWDTPDWHRASLEAICGWVEDRGWAFESGELVVDGVLDVAADYGFREVTPGDVLRQWRASRGRWCECRIRALRRHGLA